MSKKIQVKKQKQNLTNLEPFGVDLVDNPAIEKKFLITKRNEDAGVYIKKSKEEISRTMPASVLVVKDESKAPEIVDIGDVALQLNSLIEEIGGRETAPAALCDLLAQARKTLSGDSVQDALNGDTNKPTEKETASETSEQKPDKESKEVDPKETETKASTSTEAVDAKPDSESSTTPVETDETVHPSTDAKDDDDSETDAEIEAYLEEAIDREIVDQEAGAAALA